MIEREIELKGHLIDSQILSRVWNRIVELGGQYNNIEFSLGKTHEDESYAKIIVKATSEEQLKEILEEISDLGVLMPQSEAVLRKSEKDNTLPSDFYSTTNHPTEVFVDGTWIKVKNQRMDAVVWVSKDRKSAECRRFNKIKKGDLIVCGTDGIRVSPPEKPRDLTAFEFMSNVVSSERDTNTRIKQIAAELKNTKERGGKIAVVAGPAVVHTGADEALANLIKGGWVDYLLTGNALAVHDIEKSLFGTSLGVALELKGFSQEEHKNHMRAINEVWKAGSIKKAVEGGVVTSGVMYECVKKGVPFVLAGSIRDDLLPDTITDVVRSQDEYFRYIKDCDVVIMLASMLHSIAVGNMISSSTKTIVVDINPAVVTKLVDRGTSQAIGIVTDVGLFLEILERRLR